MECGAEAADDPASLVLRGTSLAGEACGSVAKAGGATLREGCDVGGEAANDTDSEALRGVDLSVEAGSEMMAAARGETGGMFAGGLEN